MSSNTSKGRGSKGSKFWMQTLLNLDNGAALSKAIQVTDPKIGAIEWLSPLYKDNYQEFRTQQIIGINPSDIDFWPKNGPWWDGVGIDEHGCILLVEAKAHPKETLTKCSADSVKSKQKIKQTMNSAHDSMVPTHPYNKDVWFKKYYQLGNRLAFLVKLREKGYNVKLVLLNIVEDPTHIMTTEKQWQDHYKDVFSKMLGNSTTPNDVVMVNFRV